MKSRCGLVLSPFCVTELNVVVKPAEPHTEFDTLHGGTIGLLDDLAAA